ncbi:NADH dehydrogenase [Rhodanobacter sp. ANJX3]|uniref:NAD(P)/FAD-dependent oxidoreductase n=1 Tax=Rhodanobacter sp. ANJX3 TaxID=2723083 RepID=UPI00161E2DE4|nr:NAD(P)/FAD-dependent oxidoreductase [Rhodanobacter sp. ANJX3]MBB5357102.1 NADH dehydrogenase [Rhodanobacter sp. ANJX3]
MSQIPASTKNIVIVGGGAGGAELAAALGRRFGRSTMNVTLVDCATHHLWKPRLHEVAAGLLGAGEDETSYLALGRANHFQFRLGALVGLAPFAKTISLAAVKDSQGGDLLGPRDLQYDQLVLAFGSQVNDFGIEGVAEYCHMLDSGDQALAFQRHLLEQAVRVSDGALERLSIGIVGAGATGVELAAELHHAVSAMHRFGGLMPAEQLDITLVDMAPRVLANSDPSTSAYAMTALKRFGVRVHLNAGVERITAEGLFLKGGEFVPCVMKVWASGIIGRPLAATLEGITVDRSRRLVCDDHLRCQGVNDIYALGDCALTLDPSTQRPLPATAQVAHQQADYLAKQLAAPPAKIASRPFVYRPMGSLVSLGTAPAAGELPRAARSPITFRGLTPKVLYSALQLMHRGALIGWGRTAVLALADRLRRITAPPVKLH